MVSKPNFVLGIKQLSLCSKEVSHALNRFAMVMLLAHKSRLHSFTQLPQNYHCYLAAMSSISQACRASSFRSVQIKPSPNETNYTDVLLNLLREKPRSTATIGSCTRLHKWTESLAHYPTCRHDFLMCTSSISQTHWPIGLVVRRSIKHKNPIPTRSCTHFNAPPRFHHWPYALVIEARDDRPSHTPSTRRRTLLTSLDDVITPCQQPRKNVHISPSHVSATS